jgi:hypothetical protein
MLLFYSYDCRQNLKQAPKTNTFRPLMRLRLQAVSRADHFKTWFGGEIALT